MQDDFCKSFVVVFVIYRHNCLTEILDNISVNMSTKRYDTDTSFSFHLTQAFGAAKGFVNSITK